MSQEQESSENREKIGKGNPPKHTQFKKGEVSNPKGRGKGTLNRSTLINKWLLAKEKVKNPITQKVENLTQEDLVIIGQIAAARKGSKPSADFLFDGKYGKQTTPIEIDANILSVDWKKLEDEFDRSVIKKKSGSLKQTTKKSSQ